MVYFQQQQNLWICMVFVVIIFLVCGYANKYQLTVTVWFKILFLKISILRTLNKCHYLKCSFYINNLRYKFGVKNKCLFIILLILVDLCHSQHFMAWSKVPPGWDLWIYLDFTCIITQLPYPGPGVPDVRGQGNISNGSLSHYTSVEQEKS